MITFALSAAYVGIVTLGVAFGLAVFQYVIMPLVAFGGKVLELINERDSGRRR